MLVLNGKILNFDFPFLQACFYFKVFIKCFYRDPLNTTHTQKTESEK